MKFIKTSRFIFLVITMYALAVNVHAKKAFDNSDPIFMIEACKEVVEIYKSKDEKRFLASQRTSLAEAMRAGYCIGALQQITCNNRFSKRNWMVAAKSIAQLNVNLRENKVLKPLDILAHGACQ